VLAVVVLAGGGWILGKGSLGAGDPQGVQGSSGVVDNLAACGDLLCPTTPLCWGGLVSISGRAQPPGRVDCTAEHRWETFLAARLPADAVEVRQDSLLERPDIAAVCSAARLAERSLDESQTAGWTVDAWPVELPDGSWIFHCMVNSGNESEGSVARLTS
jgi:serine/threonine-protein kinase